MRRASLRLLVGPLTLLAAVLLIGNVIVFAAWTAPRWSTRLGVAVGGGSVTNARQRIEPALRGARETYGRLARAEEDLGDFRDRLVAQVSAATLLGMLDGAGDRVGIDLDDSTLQYVQIEELGVLQLGITFPVTGRYQAVRLLLDELAALPVFLVVDGVGLQTFNVAEQAAPQTVRVDLAVSVFLTDREIAASPAAAVTPVRPVVSARETEALRRAIADDDPAGIADAAIAALAALPALPVDPEALVVDLGQLGTPMTTSEPRRNLFSVVLPPEPEPVIFEEPEIEVEPEPVLPVRLLGVLAIDGRWHASLTDEQRVYIVKAGDRLPNGVEVVDVGKDFAELTYRDRTSVLNLEGTRP